MRKPTDYRPVILKQAAQLFARKPFHEVLMDDVAAKAGIAKGTIYRFYPNKEELYAALCFDWMDEMTSSLRQIARQESDTRACLERMLRGIAEHYRRHHDLFQILQRQETMQTLCRREAFLQRRTAVRAVLVKALRRGQTRGELRRMNPGTVADLILGMLRSLLRFGDPQLTPHAIAQTVLNVLLHGTGQPKQARRCRTVKFLLLHAIWLSALVLLLSGCSNPSGAPPNPAKGERGMRAYPVRTAQVTVQPVKYLIETTGTVEAQDIYRIDARMAGTVEDVAFNEGDEVTTEKILCRISPLSYTLAAKKAEAVYKKALADLNESQRRTRNDVELARVRLRQAEVEVARRKAVHAAGALAEEEVMLYEARRDLTAIELKSMEEATHTLLVVMQATVREKEADWKIAEEHLRLSAVAAPIDGIIEERLVTNGMQVTPGTAIAMLVEKGALRLRFNLPERQAPHVHVGAELTFRVEAYPNRTFKASVYRIGDLTDPRTRQVTCWALVEPSEARLKPGFFAAVTLISDSRAQAVVVPVAATLPTERGFVAYVLADGKAVQRSLKLGLHVTGDSVEVLSGLAEGETIVVEGANALQDGVPVTELDAQRGAEKRRPRQNIDP